MKIVNICKTIVYSLIHVMRNAPALFILSIIQKIITSSSVYLKAYVGKNATNIIAIAISQSIIDLDLLYYSALLIIIDLVLGIITTLCNYFIMKSLSRYNDKMAIVLSNSAASFPLKFWDIPQNLDDLRQANTDSGAIISIYNGVVNIIISFISFAVSFIICFKLNYILAIISVLVSLPSFFISKKINESNYDKEKELNLLNRKIGYYQSIFFSKENYMEFHLFSIRKIFEERLHDLLNERFLNQYKLTRINTIKETILSIGTLLINAFVNFGIVIMIILKHLTLGDYSYYNTILGNLKSSVSSMSITINEIIISYKRVNNYLNFYKNNNTINKAVSSNLIINDIKEIEFKNVSFKYPQSEKYALNNISFSIKNKEKIAFAGLNGAGKTTLVKLLLGFYTPDSGSILVNGYNMQNINLYQYRKLFSAMYQVPSMYLMTLRENVAISDFESINNTSKIMDAIKQSGLDFSSQQLDICLGKEFADNGIVPSHGQLQKINLARTLFRDAKVYILDEPSASLDPMAEFNIFNSILETSCNRCLVLISHKLSNLKHMDKIILIKEGKIIEMGSHEELMDKEGEYSKLYKLQSDQY